MIIQPSYFSLLFYIVVLYVGIDFTVSGILIGRDQAKPVERSWLLGWLILKMNQRFFDRMQNQNPILQSIYSFRSIKFFTIMAGILIIIGSLILIIDILL